MFVRETIEAQIELLFLETVTSQLKYTRMHLQDVA